MFDTTILTSAVAVNTLDARSPAHSTGNNLTNAHTSTSKPDDTGAPTTDPTSATRHSTVQSDVGITSAIQRAGVNSTSSSGRLVRFTTTITSFSSETLTVTSGGSTFITTTSVPVKVTSTGTSTRAPTSTSVLHHPPPAHPKGIKPAIVGVIVVVVAVPLLLVGICIGLFMRRRRQRSRRSRAENRSQKQMEESLHPVTLSSPAHITHMDTDTTIAPNPKELAQPTSNPFETPAEQLAALPHSTIQMRPRMIVQTEINNVRSQMVALEHSNQKMRTTVAEMKKHVQRLEAEGSEFSDAQPPAYVSS